jgi:hypothetical protein
MWRKPDVLVQPDSLRCVRPEINQVRLDDVELGQDDVEGA